MSELFAYICTKQSSDPFIPPTSPNLNSFSRDVSDAFYIMQGGFLRVGQIAFFPAQRSVPFHLLCNGQEVPKASFPELYSYLGDFEGTPVDPENFVLPNFIGSITPAAAAAPETVEGGTVTSETPSPGEGDSGGSIDPAVVSGSAYEYLPPFWGPF